MTHESIFSLDRRYRYTLWRSWDISLPCCQFIGLNPSTADETKDDPTIRRCIEFSKRWGFGALCMTNIFAWRDTLPQNMKRSEEPVGLNNDHYLKEVARIAGRTVAAWGNHGSHMNRGTRVKLMLTGENRSLLCFKLTKERQPEHPLYQPYERELIPFN